MPRSLLYGLKLLGRSRRKGFIEIVNDIFRKYSYPYMQGLADVPVHIRQQQYYPDYLPPRQRRGKILHLTVSSDVYRSIGDLSRIHTMTFNDFAIQVLSERMGQELMKDPMLFLRYIPSY